MKKNKRQKTSQPVHQTKQKKISVKKSDKKIKSIAIIMALITFFLNIFLIPDKAELLFFKIDLYFFYSLNLFLSGLVFYSLSNKKHSRNIAKYSFLLLLVSCILLSFFQVSVKSSPSLINLHKQLLLFAAFIILPAIFLGIIALWIDKNKLRAVINNVFSEDKPKTKWFSKPEISYTSAFIVILGISAITLFYRLDGFDLYSDEAQVNQSAAGYLESGDYYQLNFATQKLSVKATRRAVPHQWLVAQSYKLFGISEWSSRFPSAVFGFLLTVLAYFIGYFFTKDRLTALLISFSFVFYFEFLNLERWARMYAVLMPVYLATSYFLLRFITENSILVNKKFDKNGFVYNYLNYNYELLIILLPLLVFAYYLHTLALFIMVSAYIFTLIKLFFFKERRYLSAVLIGILLIIIGYNTIPNVNALSRIKFFTGNFAELYTQAFFNYPFNISASIILIIISAALLFIIKNKDFRNKYLFLLINVVFGWFLFAYLIDYKGASFRYVSFIAPLGVILATGTFMLIISVLYKKALRIVLIIFFFTSVLIQYSFKYNALYVKNEVYPARMSVAWKDIVERYKKGEIIYRHWGSSFYFQGVDTSAKFLGVGGYQGKPFNEIYDTLKKYPSGWLTWHTYHAWRMDDKLLDYTNLYFKKLHGRGIDNTNVEVYYYTDSMLVDTLSFLRERYIPAANINLKNDFSIGFWINLNENDTLPPFLFLNEQKRIMEAKLSDNKQFTVKYQDKVMTINDLPLMKWHYLTIIHNSEKSTISLYLDSELSGENSVQEDKLPIVKFKVNPFFRGQIDDISIYNLILSKEEINFIIKNRVLKNKELLWMNDKPLKTLFHWQKK